MGISAAGIVAREARPTRQSMAKREITTTIGSSTLELSSGIMWASGGSMSSIRSTMVLLREPTGFDSTLPKGACISLWAT